MSNKQKLMEYFLQNPTTKLRVRQIERTLKMPLPSITRYLKELVNEQILKKEKIAEITLYSANWGEQKYLLEKKLFNLRQLHESGLIDFLIEEYDNPLIILFGSYAKAEDTEKSDIDLYIETPIKKKVNVKKFEHSLKREIQLFILKNLKEIPNIHLANSILNGQKLHGHIEVFYESMEGMHTTWRGFQDPSRS